MKYQICSGNILLICDFLSVTAHFLISAPSATVTLPTYPAPSRNSLQAPEAVPNTTLHIIQHNSEQAQEERLTQVSGPVGIVTHPPESHDGFTRH
jgi:hypothetical protein